MSCLSCFNSELREAERRSKVINDQLKIEKDIYKRTNSLLLLGESKSGKSTVVKQIKILYKDGYSNTERFEKVLDICSNIKDIITTVIKVMPKLDPPLRIADPKNKKHEHYILNVVDKTPNFEYSPEFFEMVECLWEDEGVKEAYERSNEYQLLECAEYFMVPDKLQEVAKPDFKPSNMDILRCQVMTSRVSETMFEIERMHFDILDVCGQSIERGRNWIRFVCGGGTTIIYVIDCSSFSTVIREDEKITRLHESIELFESVRNDRSLSSIPFFLFLNKQDKLKKKLEEGKKLEEYFPDFASYSAPNISAHELSDSLQFTRAKYFIQDQFMKLSTKTHYGSFCYPHFTTAIDTENVRQVFETSKDIICGMHMINSELL